MRFLEPGTAGVQHCSLNSFVFDASGYSYVESQSMTPGVCIATPSQKSSFLELEFVQLPPYAKPNYLTLYSNYVGMREQVQGIELKPLKFLHPRPSGPDNSLHPYSLVSCNHESQIRREFAKRRRAFPGRVGGSGGLSKPLCLRDPWDALHICLRGSWGSGCVIAMRRFREIPV